MDRTTYSIVYEIWEPPEDKGGKLNSYSQLNFPEKSGKIKNENNYHLPSPNPTTVNW